MMKVKQEIKKKIIEERKKSIKLRGISIDKSLSFEKAQEIKKEQQKHYDKYNFLKGLDEAMRKEEIKIYDDK